MEGMRKMAKFTKVAVYDDGDIKSFITRGQRNPCGCGSNCYHYVTDGVEILGICNACETAIYQVNTEYVEKTLAKEKWRDLDKAVYY